MCLVRVRSAHGIPFVLSHARASRSPTDAREGSFWRRAQRRVVPLCQGIWRVVQYWQDNLLPPEHADAYAHFNAFGNEAMSRAAVAARYDTVQFTAHRDQVNYPCTSTVGYKYPYMNIEIVAVKLKGTYSCGGCAGKPGCAGFPDDSVLRGGWHDVPCKCDNSFEFSNCGRSLSPLAHVPDPHRSPLGTVPPPDAHATVSADCSNTSAVAPPWFSTCKRDGGCMRVQVASPLTALVLGNSTNGTAHTAGFQWCIDYNNALVYAKVAGTPQGSIAFFQVENDRTSHACRFLTHHWVDGDLVRVYQQDGLNCTLDWKQIPDNVTGVTEATLDVAEP